MKIKCPACSKVLSIPEAAAGKIVKCPCGKQLRAPSPKTASAGAARAPTPPQPATPSPSRTVKPAPLPSVSPASNDDFFDEMTDTDLQGVRPVAQPGRASSSHQLNPYGAPADLGGGAVGSTLSAGLATPGARILAALVDTGMFLAAGALALGIAFGVGAMSAGQGNGELSPTVNTILLVLFYALILTPYLINIVLISKSGQSVGKKVMKLRIVNAQTGVQASFADGVFKRMFLFGIYTSIPLIGAFVAIADIGIFVQGRTPNTA